MNIRIPAIKSDKERHHLSKNAAQHLDEKLYQLIHGDNNGHRHEDEKENEDSRYKEIERGRQPLECSKNKVYHLTTHFQNDTHEAEQQDNAEHEVNEHLYRKGERIEEAATEREELANVRKDKKQISYQSHTFPSNPAPLSK